MSRFFAVYDWEVSVTKIVRYWWLLIIIFVVIVLLDQRFLKKTISPIMIILLISYFILLDLVTTGSMSYWIDHLWFEIRYNLFWRWF